MCSSSGVAETERQERCGGFNGCVKLIFIIAVAVVAVAVANAEKDVGRGWVASERICREGGRARERQDAMGGLVATTRRRW